MKVLDSKTCVNAYMPIVSSSTFYSTLRLEFLPADSGAARHEDAVDYRWSDVPPNYDLINHNLDNPRLIYFCCWPIGTVWLRWFIDFFMLLGSSGSHPVLFHSNFKRIMATITYHK